MASEQHIDIDLREQTLTLLDAQNHEIKQYDMSSATKGGGEFEGSNQTPRGKHRIRAKIGAGEPPGTVFKNRRPTGEIYSLELAESAPREDWVLSRILWLCGEEIGRNRLGGMDSMRRLIYIHGAADTVVMGKPGSTGCIRMSNSDVIDLFDRIEVGTKVVIHE